MTFPAAPQLPSPSTLTTSAKFMLPCLSHFIYFETAQTEDQSDFMIMLHAYPSPYRARALASGWSCLWIHGCTRGLGGGGHVCAGAGAGEAVAVPVAARCCWGRCVWLQWLG